MKAVKVLVIILLAVFSFGTVNAQVAHSKKAHHKHHHGKKQGHKKPLKK